MENKRGLEVPCNIFYNRPVLKSLHKIHLLDELVDFRKRHCLKLPPLAFVQDLRSHVTRGCELLLRGMVRIRCVSGESQLPFPLGNTFPYNHG